ncbi:hypothetical protein V5799_008770, partial [Amblyomma americanum]
MLVGIIVVLLITRRSGCEHYDHDIPSDDDNDNYGGDNYDHLFDVGHAWKAYPAEPHRAQDEGDPTGRKLNRRQRKNQGDQESHQGLDVDILISISSVGTMETDKICFAAPPTVWNATSAAFAGF